ncbi:MAG: HAMP domain-containing sensor histidine kinase [Halobacteriales archaeon]|nr:HAMP domain-containing sensor histidine kinase [Halobacteriales archaeon]
MAGFEISKRDLGGAYLFSLAIGFVLAVGVNLYLYPLREASIVIGAASGGLLALSLVYVGIRIYRSNLNDEQVWTISQWSSVGLGITTLLAVFGIFTFDLWTALGPTYFLNLSAAGGVTGALVASIHSLQTENRQTVRLYRRNIVLQRVLRHNIRNSMNVMRGYADILEDDLQGPNEEMAESIRRQADSVASLSETVRDFTSLDADRTTKSVDIVSLLDAQLDAFTEYHPYVTIERTMPAEAWGRVDDLLEVAVWHLLENVIHYNDDRAPTLSLSVSTDADTITVHLSDDSTGIPQQVLAAVRQGQETQLEHTDGLGLWLAKWLIEDYGGEIRFDDDDAAGTDVRFTIPRAEQPVQPTNEVEVVA